MFEKISDKLRAMYGGGKSANAIIGFLAAGIVYYCKKNEVELPFTEEQIALAFLTLLGVQGAIGKAVNKK